MAIQQEQPHHVRSNSLPVGSHPIALQFEEELQNMKRWASSAEASTSKLCQGLKGLVKLHSCVENLFKMAKTQTTIACRKNEKWLAEELDGYVSMLDICSSTRDSLSLVEEQTQDLQSALRTRRVGDKISQSKSQSYLSSCKKTTKECLKVFKAMKDRCVVYPEMVDDEDLCLVVKALKEVREITITVYTLMFSLVTSKDGGYWSFVSKAVTLKQKVSPNNTSINDSLIDLCKKMCTKDIDVAEAHKQIKEIACDAAMISNGLEFLFQGLIRNRVALLNIVNL